MRVAGADALRLLEVAEGTIQGVVYGIIGTALAQAVLQVIGLLLAGVPGALLLGGLTFFLSVVPVGPPMVWGGAAAWLYFNGQMGWAIFVALWGFFVVSTVDNVIKPYLIARGANLPFVLVLLGVLGGVLAFGVIGVFIGPTLLAVGYRVMLEWSAMRQEEAGAADAGN
jgi:predicted PurR-regulated permease PerM